MAFCPNCGAQANGTFLRELRYFAGKHRGTAPGYSAMSQAGGLSDNVAGALCYVPFLIGLIIDIVMLLVAPYSRNRNVRFHAPQSLFLHAALFVFWIAVSMLMGVISLATHGLGALTGVLLYPLLSLAMIGLFVYLIFQTYNNRKIKLPVIGDLAEKQA